MGLCALNGINGVHIHWSLFKLELLINECFFPESVTLSSIYMYLHLFLYSSSLFDILLSLLLFISLQQLFGLSFEDVDFMLEFFLFVLELLDFKIKSIASSLNFEFFLLSIILGRWWGWSLRFFCFVFSSKNLIKEWHGLSPEIIMMMIFQFIYIY